MCDITILEKLIHQDVIIKKEEPVYPQKTCWYELTEQESDYSVKVMNPPSKTLVIKCDKFPETSKFFKGLKKECKRADYIIFSCSKKTVLIIELKRSKKSADNDDIIAQLKGAKCIIDYCKSVGTLFFEKNFMDDYEYKFYRYLHETKKRSFAEIKKKQQQKNNAPDEFRTISGATISFATLLR